MPWPEKQRRAIFLRIKRERGEAAARDFMRKHGYGDDDTNEKRKRAAKRHAR